MTRSSDDRVHDDENAGREDRSFDRRFERLVDAAVALVATLDRYVAIEEALPIAHGVRGTELLSIAPSPSSPITVELRCAVRHYAETARALGASEPALLGRLRSACWNAVSRSDPRDSYLATYERVLGDLVRWSAIERGRPSRPVRHIDCTSTCEDVAR